MKLQAGAGFGRMSPRGLSRQRCLERAMRARLNAEIALGRGQVDAAYDFFAQAIAYEDFAKAA